MLSALRGWAATRQARKFWATREQDNPTWVQGYWDQRNHPLRERLAEVTSQLDGSNLLEVGTHCGVNLWALAQKKTYRKLVGVDISRHVLEYGRQQLAQPLNQPHELLEVCATKLPFSDRTFDIVLTSNLLVCVGDSDIHKVLSEIARVSHRYIVLCEPFPDREGPDPYPNTTYWIRDYAKRLARLGYRQVSMERLPEGQNIGHMNSILVLEREEAR